MPTRDILRNKTYGSIYNNLFRKLNKQKEKLKQNDKIR